MNILQFSPYFPVQYNIHTLYDGPPSYKGAWIICPLLSINQSNQQNVCFYYYILNYQIRDLLSLYHLFSSILHCSFQNTSYSPAWA